ncbi:MAG: FHA domain-containing protein [Oscillospiraceae bacterium]|nr:FHA domain-containing protein [Oscillospiraceae bacterium]
MIWLLIGILVGVVIGLIPFFIARGRCRDNMGTLAMVCCLIAGVFDGLFGIIGLSIFVAIGFTIAIMVSTRDSAPISRNKGTQAGGVVYYNNNNGGTAPAQYGSVGVMAISGSLKGRVYGLGNGLTFGRNASNGVRFSAGESGVSSNHCRLYRQGNAIMLVDLGSSYGTFLDDGRQLMRNNPVSLGIGSRFYLGTRNNTFEVVQN